MLEKKRPSITRLKHVANEIDKLRAVPWKEKTLDYEIETGRVVWFRGAHEQ